MVNGEWLGFVGFPVYVEGEKNEKIELVVFLNESQ